MRHPLPAALAVSLLLTTAACAPVAVSPSSLAPLVAAPVGHAKADASRQRVAAAIAEAPVSAVRDMGRADGASVAVSFQLPPRRAAQAVQHRWIASDIRSYRVRLLRKGADGAYGELAELTVDPAASYNTSTVTPKALAAFTGLEANQEYQVTVTAWGANPVTPATATLQPLNTQTPAVATFDFRENAGTIEDAPPAQDLAIVLDSFVFSGKATIHVGVTDGQYLPDAGGISARAIVPPPPPAPHLTSALVGIGHTATGVMTFQYQASGPLPADSAGIFAAVGPVRLHVSGYQENVDWSATPGADDTRWDAMYGQMISVMGPNNAVATLDPADPSNRTFYVGPKFEDDGLPQWASINLKTYPYDQQYPWGLSVQ